MLSGLVAAALGAWLLGGRRLAGRRGPWRPAAVAVEHAVAALVSRLGPTGPAEDPVALCRALSAELRAGAPPDAALLAVAEHGGLVPRAVAAARLGEPVAAALAADAAHCRHGRHAAEALVGMAACWSAAADAGVGLADGLDRVATLAAARERVGADLQMEIAAPRATARILSLLPLLGIALGELLGARPISWLLTGPAGWACLGLGAVLLLAGRLWSERIVASALPGPAGRR